MSAATPEQAAANAFVTGCVERGLTATQACVPPEGQLATVRGLWADVAHAAIAAAQPQDGTPGRFAAEVRRAPCPVAGHDGEHFQWRAGEWMCGHVLAASLALAGIIPPPELAARTGAQPELPAVEAKLRATAADNIGLRAQLAAVSALSADMHAEADASGDDRVASVLHEYASRIRLALGPEPQEQQP